MGPRTGEDEGGASAGPAREDGPGTAGVREGLVAALAYDDLLGPGSGRSGAVEVGRQVGRQVGIVGRRHLVDAVPDHPKPVEAVGAMDELRAAARMSL